MNKTELILAIVLPLLFGGLAIYLLVWLLTWCGLMTFGCCYGCYEFCGDIADIRRAERGERRARTAETAARSNGVVSHYVSSSGVNSNALLTCIQGKTRKG